jgi:methionyl-tRNA formyltransferase
LRIVFFGTPDFAVPTLERLLAGPHEVALVVSQPDRPRGRGRALQPSPVSERALAAGVPLLRPERVGDELAALARSAPDLGIVVAFGQFLPKGVRELPARGYCINAHASLLPRWRGAAPIARAILAGDTRTGVSVMKVEREMDAGAVAMMRELAISADESCGELTERLARLAADAIADALPSIESDTVKWQAQDHSRATLAPKLEREEARLDWNEPARALALRVRAFAPAPGAFTEWQGEPLRILRARADGGAVDRAPGTVQAVAGALRVATGEGWLVPLELQRAGGRPLATDAFLRGRSIPDGARLAPDASATLR